MRGGRMTILEDRVKMPGDRRGMTLGGHVTMPGDLVVIPGGQVAQPRRPTTMPGKAAHQMKSKFICAL